VDGTYSVDEDGERTYIPRTPEEMQKLGALVRAAIGFDRDRGDQLSVENIAFDDTEMQRNLMELEKAHRLDMIQKIGGVVVSLLLAGGALLLLWRILKKTTIVSTETKADDVALLEDEEDSGRKEADLRALRLEKKVTEIQGDPAQDIARIVRAWMREA
jgi:flagellar M-ring protein FliF